MAYMPIEYETVAIHSPKDPSVVWRINKDDFDPTVHMLWDEMPPPTEHEQPETVPPIAEPETAPPAEDEPEPAMTPEDTEQQIAIRDPEDMRRKMYVSSSQYNPTIHVLWER